MRKHLLLLVFVFVASAVQAQAEHEIFSIMYHDTTGYFYSNCHAMQQRDGNILMEIFLSEDVGTYIGVPFGNLFYKISPAPLAIIDSLFVPNPVWGYAFLARDPRGEGNIRAVFEYHEDCDSSFVRISHFPDDDLHALFGEDILVPICEGVVLGAYWGSIVDSRGDLIMTYYKPLTEFTYEQYIVRIGPDGTVKHQSLLEENYDVMLGYGPFRELSESPLQYYQCSTENSSYNPQLAVYVIDSLFQRSTVILNNILSSEIVGQIYGQNITVNEYLTIEQQTEVLPAGGDDVLVASKYTYDTNFLALTQDCGVAVAKYNLRTKQLKNYAVFNDNHAYYSTGRILGLKMLEDGTVYFAYMEDCYPHESFMVVKMDVNFNVVWKRFCKTRNITIGLPVDPPIVLEDETGEEKSIVWSGYGHRNGIIERTGWICLLLNHDGPVGLSEDGIEIRPYTFYPNPAKSELYFQFSPDVAPERVELYDLQGRLVHSQSKGLESLDIQGLAAGQYLVKVTLDNGQAFTDKMVKE